MKRPAGIALFVLIAAYGSSAWGWGVLGHAMTGAIADRLLDAKARAAVAELLSQDLHASGQPSYRTTLADVASWADEIRGGPVSQPTWHYDNLAACGHGTAATACPQEQCSTAQMGERLRILRNAGESRRRRNEALKWIVHLVGDIHQPLHAADNGDSGGNAVKVKLVGLRIDEDPRELVLHHVWDRQFVLLAFNAGFNDEVPADIEVLAAQGKALLASKGLGTPASWALESNTLAREVAYNYNGFACERASRRRIALDAQYQRAAASVVRERVLLGGARLAELLNRALGDSN